MNDYHGKTNISDCHIINLEMNHHRNGNLTVVQNGKEIPFDTERVYYLYDVPAGAERGGHSHKECYSLIVAASGCFDVIADDGYNKKRFTLNRPNQALLIAPGIWNTLENFSGGSVCLVIASNKYIESDYIRNYDDFKAAILK